MLLTVVTNAYVRETIDYYKLYPDSDKIHRIPHFTVESIFIVKFHDSISVFHIMKS